MMTSYGEPWGHRPTVVSDFAPCDLARQVPMSSRPQIFAASHGDLAGPELPGRAALRTRHGGITDCGPYQMHNEDAFIIDERLGLFVVCDGVGGRAHGEIASAEAVMSIWEYTRQATVPPGPGVERGARLGAELRLALQHASQVVHGLATTDQRLAGMSTMASAVLVAGDVAVIGHVGDTRVYHARGSEVRQLTEDHTLRNMQVRRGSASPPLNRRHKSPVVRVLGGHGCVDVDVIVTPLVAGDRLLLCTDGLHEYLDDDTTLSQLFCLDVREASQAAVACARRRGAKDNITAVFVEVIGDS